MIQFDSDLQAFDSMWLLNWLLIWFQSDSWLGFLVDSDVVDSRCDSDVTLDLILKSTPIDLIWFWCDSYLLKSIQMYLILDLIPIWLFIWFLSRV